MHKRVVQIIVKLLLGASADKFAHEKNKQDVLDINNAYASVNSSSCREIVQNECYCHVIAPYKVFSSSYCSMFVEEIMKLINIKSKEFHTNTHEAERALSRVKTVTPSVEQDFLL